MSTNDLCFRAKIKHNVYPCNPKFYYIKVGVRGSTLYGLVSRMVFSSQASIDLQCKKLKRTTTLQCQKPMDKRKNTGLLNFHTYLTYQISRSYL